MPCSICRQTGHNRSTCPRSLVIPGLPPRTPPLMPPPPPVVAVVARSPQISAWDQRSNSSRRTRKRWTKAINTIKNLQNYYGIVLRWSHLGFEDPRIFYHSWKSNKQALNRLTHLTMSRIFGRGHLENVGIFQAASNACHIFNLSNTPNQGQPNQGQNNQGQNNQGQNNNDDLRPVTLVNLRQENYLVYWVLGNYMIQDLDRQENNIRYMGLALKGATFFLKTMNGHRFYLIPHRMNTEPAYHPEKDSEFFIPYYCQINIHDKTESKIYIDEKDELSELNRWKFNSLKLDFLVKEVIKLGGKNNDILESVLDLHDDIKLDSCSEWLKDIAGVPSTFTNIT